MKPRLVSRSLTSEDVMIWRRWRRHVGDPWYGRLRIEYGAADIRDANLLFIAQAFKLGCEFQGRRVRQYPIVTDGPMIPLAESLSEAGYFP